jgi:hypothetical protein
VHSWVWGHRKVLGELRRLGHHISEATTMHRFLHAQRRRPGCLRRGQGLGPGQCGTPPGGRRMFSGAQAAGCDFLHVDMTAHGPLSRPAISSWTSVTGPELSASASCARDDENGHN